MKEITPSPSEMDLFRDGTKKPSILYHGTVTSRIEKFKPRKRCTPGELDNVGAQIYAGLTPAYAAAHAIPWSSSEGVRLSCSNNSVTFEVPKKIEERLNQPIYVYEVPSNTFKLLNISPKGYNFASKESVRPVSVEGFDTVWEAIEKYGGRITILD